MKKANDTPSTTPPDFTEQARQLVDEWNQTLHGEHDTAYNNLIKRIASFAAEAATQGQVVGIERAVSAIEKAATAFKETHGIAPCAGTVSDLRRAVMALSPDPFYLDRVRNEAVEAALEQERESWLKAVTGTIDAGSSGSPDYVSGFINGTLAAQKQIMDRLPVMVRPDAAIGDDKEQQQ